MTDSHRKAAEEWVRERAQIEDRANWITVDTAHLAGQECGEQRAVERIVAKMRDRAEVWGGTTYCALNDMADEIERGEWRDE